MSLSLLPVLVNYNNQNSQIASTPMWLYTHLEIRRLPGGTPVS